MITIIFGKPRKGKTALMSWFLTQEAFNLERINNCKREISNLNAGGFNLTYPGYIVGCNFKLECHSFGYSPRPAKYINPYRLGFFNQNVKTHFIPPYMIIGIMEAQQYFNSRNFMLYPDWQSRFYEAHGHYYLDIFMDTQRPNLIDVNIRDLSRFIEILELEIGQKQVVWTVREIDSSSEYEKYISSGKSDKSTYIEYQITAPRKVLDYYDTRERKPLFFAGHFGYDFDRLKYTPAEASLSYFKEYCNNYEVELPKDFYKKEIRN